MNKIMFLKAYGKRTLAQDSFDRANGAIGTAEFGGAWTINAGSFNIVSNKAKAGTSGFSSAATLAISPLDYEVSADVTWSGDSRAAIVARCDSSGITNYMRLYTDGSSIVIGKIIASSATALATYSYSWTSGTTHNLKLACNGNNFSAYLDGVLVASVTNDNATKTLKNAGISASPVSGTPTSLFDNFLVMG